MLETFLIMLRLPTVHRLLGPKQIAISSEFLTPFMNELPNPSPEVTEALQLYVLPTLNQAAANFSLGFSTALKVSRKKAVYALDKNSHII